MKALLFGVIVGSLINLWIGIATPRETFASIFTATALIAIGMRRERLIRLKLNPDQWWMPNPGREQP